MDREDCMMQVNRNYVLKMMKPVVQYGLREAKSTSVAHAMTEVGVMAYLLGMGFDHSEAHRIAESWETDERYDTYKAANGTNG